jgi:fatty-acyl-CoA synthase
VTASASTAPHVLEGLMQHGVPLALDHVLRRMRTVVGRGTVVTAGPDGARTRATYADVAARCERLAGALAELGIGPGDRVGTLQWNTQAHLEAYLAVPCMGAVLHTLNLRLFPEQLAFIVKHAEDRAFLVDGSLTPLLARIASELDRLEHVVVIGEPAADLDGLRAEAHDYEELLAAAPERFDWPALEERQAAALCYTSGTTGDPKGVLYSHRSTVLHSMGVLSADSLSVGGADRVLPVVPMFHVNAWGVPYACALSGAGLVMPGPDLSPPALARLIEEERVTLTGGVPTICAGLLAHATKTGADLSSLRLVVAGGASVPESLIRGFQEKLGLRLLQAWGMTETSPLGSVARPLDEDWDTEAAWAQRTATGRITPLVDIRLVDGDGNEVPWDGESTGEIQIRGPWIASAYFGIGADPEKFDGGWLRTGDIASCDADGYLRITDRAKDVIKSGGEWISSVELENRLMGHDDVAEAAVIAMPDERWSERPLACVVLREGRDLDVEDLRTHLAAHLARWQVPDAFAVIPEVPKTSVGKFDKKKLRAALQEGDLDIVRA